MIEEIINFKLALKKQLPKSEIREKYRKYSEAYDNYENKTIRDKIENRDLFYDFCRYMAKSDDGSKSIVY